MPDRSVAVEEIDRRIAQLFALVREALAGATQALLSGDFDTGQAIVDADHKFDALTEQVIRLVWGQIETVIPAPDELRRFVNILLVLPELERSADLAEHIAQRAMTHLGAAMSPVSRGYVQRMSELALEMWEDVATSYTQPRRGGIQHLDELDDEIDMLHDQLRREIAGESMPTRIASEVTLISRFYERLGDHAVNLARRLAGDAQGVQGGPPTATP